MANAGRQPAGGGHIGKEYLAEYTLSIDVKDNGRVKAKEVLDSLVKLIGSGSIYTCVPKAGNTWEVTLADTEAVKVALGGLKVGDTTYECREINQTTVVVSFMHLSGYIQDCQIEAELKKYGVELVSEIKRKYYKDFPEIEDGTRYVRVKFPPELKSLPYTMRFYNGKSFEHYRVVHNDQVKMCRQCQSVDHLMRDCPEFICYKCGGQGHIARACKSPKCDHCGMHGQKCTCDVYSMDDDDSIAICEHCLKYNCICHDRCDNCEKLYERCMCSPDDICKYCSVELENCQCTWCDYCGGRNCVCGEDDWGDKGSTNQTDRVSEQPQADNTSRDTPVHSTVSRPSSPTLSAADNETWSPRTEGGEGDQPINRTVVTSAPDTVAEEGRDRVAPREEHRKTPETSKEQSDNKQYNTNENSGNTKPDSSVVSLYPGGSVSSIMRPPSSIPRPVDGVARNKDGTLQHRRRRLVNEPNIPDCNKRRNIDSNYDID